MRACRKLWRWPHYGLCRPRFHALLAAGSPKQTDSIRFCSHTVQAPAKPKPFRNHSMASNPRIVRRAVLVDGPDGPVQVSPLAADLDVGLVDAKRSAVRLAEGPQPTLDQRRMGQDPAVQGGVIHRQAALPEQLLNVAAAQGVAQIPADRPRISDASKSRPLKSSLARRFSFSAIALRIIGCPRQRRVKSTAMPHQP